MILEEVEDEQRWDESFSRSPDILAKLAASAMAEYRAGKTQELDPETKRRDSQIEELTPCKRNGEFRTIR